MKGQRDKLGITASGEPSLNTPSSPPLPFPLKQSEKLLTMFPLFLVSAFCLSLSHCTLLVADVLLLTWTVNYTQQGVYVIYCVPERAGLNAVVSSVLGTFHSKY